MNEDAITTAFLLALYVTPILGVFALAALISDLIEWIRNHRR